MIRETSFSYPIDIVSIIESTPRGSKQKYCKVYCPRAPYSPFFDEEASFPYFRMKMSLEELYPLVKKLLPPSDEHPSYYGIGYEPHDDITVEEAILQYGCDFWYSWFLSHVVLQFSDHEAFQGFDRDYYEGKINDSDSLMDGYFDTSDYHEWIDQVDKYFPKVYNKERRYYY